MSSKLFTSDAALLLFVRGDAADVILVEPSGKESIEFSGPRSAAEIEITQISKQREIPIYLGWQILQRQNPTLADTQTSRSKAEMAGRTSAGSWMKRGNQPENLSDKLRPIFLGAYGIPDGHELVRSFEYGWNEQMFPPVQPDVAYKKVFRRGIVDEQNTGVLLAEEGVTEGGVTYLQMDPAFLTRFGESSRIVDLNIGRWRGTVRLRPEDLGLELNNQAQRAILERYKLGRKLLLPKRVQNDIDNIESDGRRLLRKHATLIPYGLIINKYAWPEWCAENKKIQDKYLAAGKKIADESSEYLQEALDFYTNLAPEVYQRLMMDPTAQPPTDWVEQLRRRIVESFPTAEAIQNSFHYVVTAVRLPKMGERVLTGDKLIDAMDEDINREREGLSLSDSMLYHFIVQTQLEDLSESIERAVETYKTLDEKDRIHPSTKKSLSQAIHNYRKRRFPEDTSEVLQALDVEIGNLDTQISVRSVLYDREKIERAVLAVHTAVRAARAVYLPLPKNEIEY